MSGQATYRGRDVTSGAGLFVEVGDGNILSVKPCADAGLPYLMPGLVDLQVNGFMGHDLNDGTLHPDVVEALSEALRRVGVAAYLPTLITASEEQICQRLTAIKQASETGALSRLMVAGIHVEGPSISPKDGPRGAHPKAHVRPPSISEFARWQEAAGGLIRLITLAPEWDGTDAFIRHVTSKGVAVAIGHSDASEADIERAVDAGATLSTHLGNGIAASLPRHPNAIWAQLADDRLSASVIADGHHLPRSTLVTMIRAKTVERAILVSDSVTFAGMPPGAYHSPIGGDVEVSEDGRVSVAGTNYLAGSGACLMEILCRFPGFTGMSLADAATMACDNPARFLGRSAALKEGAPANFSLLDHDRATGQVTVRDVVFAGESVPR